MKAEGIGLSHIGRHRSSNEDHLIVDNDLGLYVVADGIGGEVGGEVASRLAVANVVQYIYERQATIEAIRNGYGDESRLSTFVAAAVVQASREVYRTAQTITKLNGMGCTLTVLLMGRNTAAMAHVGDSRLYVEREGAVYQLSTDHNVAQELIELGVIRPDQAKMVWGGGNLTRAVGREEWIQVEELVIQLERGDRFIMCSEGLSDYIDSPDHLGALLAGQRLAPAVHRLIKFANTSGGHDNITAVVVDIADEQPAVTATSSSVNVFGEYNTRH